MLWLYRNQITVAGTEDLASALKDNRTLISLLINQNQITDAGATYLAAALKDNHTLIKLFISDNQITDAGTKDLALMLKDNQTLRALGLSNNQITAAGAKYLATELKENRTLTLLDLCNNQITDAGVQDLAEALKENDTLVDLSLRENLITDAGAKYLASALKNNHTLRSLILGNNRITNAGAKDLAAALKDNHTLCTLELNYGRIDDDVAEDLRRLLARNKAYRKQHEGTLLHLNNATKLLNAREIDETWLEYFNEALNSADKISEDLQREGYNQAPALLREVKTLHALAHFRTGDIHACLDIYINQLQPQPPEALSFKIASLILAEKPLDDPISNQILILMCLRGTTENNVMQYNAVQELRGVIKKEKEEGKGFSKPQPLNELVRDYKDLSVNKIVSVLDVSKPNNNNAEPETCVFYEELVLSPNNPTVHTVLAGEIPESSELGNQFEAKQKELLLELLSKYPKNPDVDLPSEPTISRP